MPVQLVARLLGASRSCALSAKAGYEYTTILSQYFRSCFRASASPLLHFHSLSETRIASATITCPARRFLFVPPPARQALASRRFGIERFSHRLGRAAQLTFYRQVDCITGVDDCCHARPPPTPRAAGIRLGQRGVKIAGAEDVSATGTPAPNRYGSIRMGVFTVAGRAAPPAPINFSESYGSFVVQQRLHLFHRWKTR